MRPIRIHYLLRVVEMPEHNVPEEPLIFNAESPMIYNPYKDEYVLQWKVPLDNGEPIDYFCINIMYYQEHSSSGKWVNSDEESEKSKYPGPTSYTIKNLNPDTYYKIELHAHNVIGFSTPAEVIMKTAQENDDATCSWVCREQIPVKDSIGS